MNDRNAVYMYSELFNELKKRVFRQLIYNAKLIF